MTQPVGSNAPASPFLRQGGAGDQASAFLQLVQAETRQSAQAEEQQQQTAAPGSSIATLPKSPEYAPPRIDLTSLQAKFDKLMKKSDVRDPNDDSEYGGTIVMDRKGNLKLVNIRKGTATSVEADLTLRSGQTLLGHFHIHPKKMPGHKPYGFSPKDITLMFRGNLNAIVMQSGDQQFMFLKTAATPPVTDFEAFFEERKRDVGRLMASPTGPADYATITQQAARDAARAYNLAYYEGKDGVFTQMVP